MSDKSKPQTLAEKIWQNHIVKKGEPGEPDLLYIDLHLIHEVTSPQAFEGLRINNRKVRRPDLTVATEDHNVPTENIDKPIADELSRNQIETLRKNTKEFGVKLHEMGSPGQGIVHVIGPEQGLTQPGMTIVCGDSHTSTHGAFGAIAFGIGTSEVEHVLATQTLPQSKPKTMLIEATGKLGEFTTAKDLILAIIAKIGTSGGNGHIIEYRGEPFKNLSMEGRMTVCNMSIEAGAKAGLIAPDETTFNYLSGLECSPSGERWDKAVESWKGLRTDDGAVFDKTVTIDVSSLKPQISWGTNPGQVTSIDSAVPDPNSFESESDQINATEALNYMGLKAGTRISDVTIDTVFIGSCTNSRIEDLRQVAAIAEGRQVDTNIRALVVPGSYAVKQQAESEGIAQILKDAGFDWREPGCSMCLAMNPDKLQPNERCASTSNRNFEGRQGRGGRTHLVSPAVAAASAITGKFTHPANL